MTIQNGVAGSIKMDTDTTASTTSAITTETSTTETTSTSISAAEAEVYDRQIRVWGLNAQLRMRNSKICILGLPGAGGEIIKNLVLAGVGAITVVDDRLVEEKDVLNHFYLSKDDIGKPWVESLTRTFGPMNPNVEMTLKSSAVSSLPPAFF